MMLTIALGDRRDLDWAQRVVTERHYLHQSVDPRARPMVYVLGMRYPGDAADDIDRVGLVMLGIPHATRCGGWWGYDGLPTQWQVVDLCRIWLDPAVQTGGWLCDPRFVPGYTDRPGTCLPPALDGIGVDSTTPMLVLHNLAAMTICECHPTATANDLLRWEYDSPHRAGEEE